MFWKVLAVSIVSAIGVLLFDRYLALCEPAVVQCDAGDVADEEAGTRLVLEDNYLPIEFELWWQEQAKKSK